MREYRAKNLERMREYGKLWARRYRKTTQHKAYKKKWRAENVEKARESARKWYNSNPDKTHRQTALRRARKNSVKSVSYNKSDIYTRDNGVCYLCDEPINLNIKWPDIKSFSIDHVIPLSKGGGDTPDNVKSSHLFCNLSKGVK